MQAREIGEHDLDCTCSDWVDNIPHLRNLLGLGIAHDRDYQVGTLWVSFRFCPWCGQPLPAITGRRDVALLEKYRRRIEEDFFAEDEWGMSQTPNMLVLSSPSHRLSREDGGYSRYSGADVDFCGNGYTLHQRVWRYR